MTSQSPIPVTILTGFLGAGKTTLLNNILHSDHGLRIAVLVNDFGAINIDSQLIVNVTDEDTIQLANGCICCTIRGDLVNALLNLIQKPEPPEYIVIEASGVSDPLEISLTFRLPELQQHIQVDSILTVIDAEQIRSLEKQDEVLAVLQIGAADIVLLNKVDLVDEAQLQKLRKWVHSIIPNARILESTYGNVPLQLVLGIAAFDPARVAQHNRYDVHVHEQNNAHSHDHAHDHSLIYETWSWHCDQPLSLRAVRKTVERLPSNVFRAKGILYLAENPERRSVLQMVGKRVSITWSDVWHSTPESQIVVIGQHGSLDAEKLRAAFEGCIASARSPMQQITGGVLSWLRGKN